MTAIPNGSAAPDILLRDTANHPMSLSRYWREQTTAFVFVRHLGCSFCQEQVKDLRDHTRALEQAGLGIVIITPDTAEHNAEFGARHALPFPLLADPQRAAYAAYGLTEGTLGQFLNPHVVSRGLSTLLRGNLPRPSAGNPRQLPGLTIVTCDGVLRYHHPARDAADHLAARRILEVATPILAAQGRERTLANATD